MVEFILAISIPFIFNLPDKMLRTFPSMRRGTTVSLLLCLFLSLSPIGSQEAYAESTWPVLDTEIQAEGAVLMDANSGTVLYQKNEHEKYFPASITKVLTAVIVLERVDNLEEMVEFSPDAVGKNLEPNSTVIAASAGDRLSVRDCLYSLLLHSANDCANALAEHVAGSNEAFAELMNEKAEELGCKSSHFMNPSGLNNPEHYSSAYDMALIMQYAIRNPLFREIDKVQAYTHAPISRYPNPDAPENTVYAHHRMMRRSYRDFYEGVFAGKTGYTTLAGNTLLTAAERDGLTLVAVILNGHSTQYSDTRKLFDFGFSSFHSLSPAVEKSDYSALMSNYRFSGIALKKLPELTIDESQRIILPKGVPIGSAHTEVSYDLSDVSEQGAVARINYSYMGLSVGSALIRLTAPDVEYSFNVETTAVQDGDNDVPESIAVNEHRAASKGQSIAEMPENKAPIVIDRESGRLRVQKPIIRLMLILAFIAGIAILAVGLIYLFQRREEFLRKRRRNRMLKHTRDLSRAQKARRDLLLGKKKSGRYRRR